MNNKIFPRSSLDMPIENPDIEHSAKLSPVEKSDEELVDSVVSILGKAWTKQCPLI